MSLGGVSLNLQIEAACAGPGPGIPTVCGVAETGILGIEQRVSALLFSD